MVTEVLFSERVQALQIFHWSAGIRLESNMAPDLGDRYQVGSFSAASVGLAAVRLWRGLRV